MKNKLLNKIARIAFFPLFILNDGLKSFDNQKYLNGLATLFLSIVLCGIYLIAYTGVAIAGVGIYYNLYLAQPKPQVEGQSIVNTTIPTSTPTVPPAKKQGNGEPQIDCFGPDGKTFKTTKTECDNFNAKWGKAPVNQVTSQPVQNTSGSTNTYTSKNYYSCTLCYHYSDENNCYTYNYLYETKEQCNTKQSEIDSLYTTTNTTNTVYQTPQPTIKPDYSYQNSQCKLGAKQWYDNQGTQCGGSCAQAIKQLALPEYQARIAACNVQWPL